ALVITADVGLEKIYGSVDPAFTYAVTSGSLVEGHRWDGQLSREQGESAGVYAITIGSLKILDENDADVTDNYTLLFEPAPFTILKKSVAISGSFTVASKPYDGETTAVIAEN